MYRKTTYIILGTIWGALSFLYIYKYGGKYFNLLGPGPGGWTFPLYSKIFAFPAWSTLMLDGMIRRNFTTINNIAEDSIFVLLTLAIGISIGLVAFYFINLFRKT